MSCAAVGEFMAHLIISDEHIHADQIVMLREFIELYGLENDQEKIFNVLEGKGGERLPQLYKELQQLSEKEQEILIENSAAIVGFNRHFAKQEKQVIYTLCKAANIDPSELIAAVNNIIESSTKAFNDRLASPEIPDKYSTVSLKVRRFFSRGAKREYLTTKIKESELSGPEYGNAIKKTGEIAEKDCQLVEAELSKIFSALESTRNEFQSVIKENSIDRNKASEDEVNFHTFLVDLNDRLDKQAKESNEELKDLVDKKRRAKNAFTIALMGRTKAGKSTLHYVMTGEGKEFIGVGAERTTRFNRVYEWENLKLIDTPGIGAAEAGGRSDEEIALSVVDTADVICYVVTSDSVQEVEFKFLSQIRNSNKPVFVLLNYKENIESPPPQYKKFVKSPLHWFSRDDEKNIQGTVNRIKRGIESYYDGNSVTIVPVHLMAAKMAMDDRCKADKTAFRSGSRVDNFFNEIRENVIELGQLRKSQTLLDNTACRLCRMLSVVREKQESSVKVAKDIENKQQKLLKLIDKQVKKNKSAFIRELKLTMESEHGSAKDFASENYKGKKKDIERNWKKEAERIDQQLKEKLEVKLKDSAAVVQEAVNEAMEDIAIGFDAIREADFDEQSTFNTSRLMSALGALMSTGGGAALIIIGSMSTPAGWVAAGFVVVGIFAGFCSGLVKSKERKRKEAIDAILKQANKNLDDLEQSYTEQVDKLFEEFHEKASRQLSRVLSRVSEQYRNSANLLTPYCNSLNNAINELNQQFAVRIIEFARDEQLPEERIGELKVTRDLGKKTEIETSLRISEQGIQRAEKALREKLTVKTLAKGVQ
mgnify:CR=1 FL=1